MRVCDWIANYLYDQGVTRVYGLMGGGASGLNDGFIKHDGIDYICFHHEQGAGHAAIADAKASGRIAVVNPTTGCGGTNTATSVLDAYQDSVPVVFISGNVKLATCTHYLNTTQGLKLRKFGVQEHDIVGTMASMTKKAYFVSHVHQVADVISRGIQLAQEGRPGPVWIDIPADIQTAEMPKEFGPCIQRPRLAVKLDLNEARAIWATAKRPVVIAGLGIRQSNTIKEFTQFIHRHGVPYVGTYGARDLTPYDDTYSIGTLGLRGDRAGNFAVQNADVLLILGSSMNNSHTGYDPAQFAPHAKKIYIDIDPSELNKDVGVPYDVKVLADLRDFFDQEQFDLRDHADWRRKTLEWKNRWPVFDPAYRNSIHGLNLYAVLEQINIDADKDAILMADAGSSSYACPVALRAKPGQNFVMTPAQADMGWALPAAIGAKIAEPGRQVVAITGDGSFMSNLQELATVKSYDLNIKYVILNNGGYLSIKNTQTKYFDRRVWGTDTDTGLWFPDLFDVAQTFGFDYVQFKSYDTLRAGLKDALESSRPTIIDCYCLHEQEILPTQALKEVNGRKIQAGLHDLYPFLDPEELDKEMYWSIK